MDTDEHGWWGRTAGVSVTEQQTLTTKTRSFMTRRVQAIPSPPRWRFNSYRKAQGSFRKQKTPVFVPYCGTTPGKEFGSQFDGKHPTPNIEWQGEAKLWRVYNLKFHLAVEYFSTASL